MAALLALSRAHAARIVLDLTDNWHFALADERPANPAAWTTVAVPHTWNARDAHEGPTPGRTPRPEERGSDYYRGRGWYRRELSIPAAWQGRRVFIVFEAVSQRAAVFCNGTRLGEHCGSFTAFGFELTPHLRFGEANELWVEADNSLVKTIAPLAGDFNVHGGMYRPVHLVVTEPCCIAPLESASPGVFVTVLRATGATAAVEIKTLLSNGAAQPAPAIVETQIEDDAGRAVAVARSDMAVSAGATALPLVQQLEIARPRLWQGRKDPYLYTVVVRVLRDGTVVDEVRQAFGVRTVALTNEGFLLNGAPYPVYGVNRHQEKQNLGWALSAEDDERDLALILDIGATAVRLAHYPQSERFHAMCDRAGLLVWEEIPFVNEVPEPDGAPDNPSEITRAFAAQLNSELREMILQRYNHPSVAWWGLFNELRPGAMNRGAMPLVTQLNGLAHALDATRLTVGATDRLGNPTSAVPDAMGYNVYPGWYTGVGAIGELSSLIDERTAERKGERVALSEYGAGGNPAQHEEGEPQKPQANRGPVHPEEWQTLMHERMWQQIRGNPHLWGTFAWVMFDFASDSRCEGGTPGINDKGLVSHDRTVTKDAYHFYRANWSDRPMAYIASRRADRRRNATTEIKAYSTARELELRIDGVPVGRATTDEFHIARWPAVQLRPGRNVLEVRGEVAGQRVTDTCTWELAAATAASDQFDGFNSNAAAATNATARPLGRTAPPFTTAANVYSGYSGPGEPVQGAGRGGWRSGREGVRYLGPNPKPGWHLDWDARQTSSDRVIELGLLPPIKPLLELHLRDTIVRRGGDGYYYLTGSTGDNIWDLNNGVELWRSTDLQKWEYRGVVWDIDRDGTWQKRCRYIWAPEILYIKGNYYLTYCMAGGPNGGTGILKSASGKAEGPYVNATTTDAPLTGGIDATLFEDDDGAVYFTWGRGTKIYRMKDDLSGFADEGHDVQIEPASLALAKEIGKGQSAAFEGASLFKRNGKYYLGGAIFIGGIDRATGRNGRYSSAIMIADSIYGPYRQWHEAVACGGGGNYFQATDGSWYCTYFGNDEASPFREKPALVRIDFAPDGKIVIADEQPAFVLRDGTPTRWRSARPQTQRTPLATTGK